MADYLLVIAVVLVGTVTAIAQSIDDTQLAKEERRLFEVSHHAEIKGCRIILLVLLISLISSRVKVGTYHSFLKSKLALFYSHRVKERKKNSLMTQFMDT